VGNYIYGSKYPTWHFPIWQISSINSTYSAVMKDLHTESKSGVMQTIDETISTNSMFISNINPPATSDLYNGYTTPYSISISPMRNSQGSFYAISSSVMNWVSGCLPLLYFTLIYLILFYFLSFL
jgi:hypothetical protein